MGQERKGLHALLAGDLPRTERLFKTNGEFLGFVGTYFEEFLSQIRRDATAADMADDFIRCLTASKELLRLWEALDKEFKSGQRISEIHQVRDLWNALDELSIGPSGPDRKWQLRHFERLEDELGNLRPAVPPQVAAKSGGIPRQQWPLLDVFVPLELVRGSERVEGEIDWSKWSKLITGERVALTGGPGSGKSTLLRHLVLTAVAQRRLQLTPSDGSTAARAEGTTGPLSPIPVWMNLPDAVFEIQQEHDTGSATRWYKHLAVELWLEPVASAAHLRTAEEARALLETGEVLLVFDGLDEITDHEARRALVEIISKLPRAFGGLGVKNSVVVACREKAWERSEAFAAFEQVRILPMDRTKWERYFDRWCRAVWEDDAEEVLRRLKVALRSSREVEKMAANPQTATMLAVLAREGDLPHQRVRLYDEYLKFALTNDRMNAYGGADQVRRHLIALAVEAQNATGPGGEPLGGISTRRARQILGARLSPSGAERTDEELRQAGESLLDDLELHTGLVTVRHADDANSVGSIASFTHRTVQEFLVAFHYVSRPNDVLEHARDRSWLVPIALTSAMLAKEEAFDALEQFLGQLAMQPSAGAARHDDLVEWGERLALLSECLEELSSWNVPRKTLEPARAAHESIGAQLEGLAPRARVAIAEGMGILGDPRLASERVTRWVEIAECSSLFGSDSEEAWVQERPLRTVHLSSYWVQRWPVLVSEYARFVEARAYADDRWWDELGARWRAEAHVEAPQGWEQMRPFGNRPVTGVSWWEARAYARWLTTVETLPEGWCVTLPTEAQWERAARGPISSSIHDAGRFPWGTEWDRDRPRASCGRILEGACPVGLFQTGHSAEGIWDLAGNIGERCLDGFGPPDSVEKNPALPEAPRDPSHFDHKFGHTVRGGDWASPVLNARVSARFPDSLLGRSDRIGFRCVAWRTPEKLR